MMDNFSKFGFDIFCTQTENEFEAFPLENFLMIYIGFVRGSNGHALRSKQEHIFFLANNK